MENNPPLISNNQNKDNSFSYFNKPISNKIPTCCTWLKKLHSEIISDKFLNETNEFRAIADNPLLNKFKSNNFDWVTFSGKFENSQANSLKKHSNLFCIDIDNIENVEEVKTLLIDKFTPALLFVSPSGKGLKVVYKIDIKQATHLDYFKAFETFFKSKFNLTIDHKCKNVNRACFLCTDKDAFYNDNAEVVNYLDIKPSSIIKEPIYEKPQINRELEPGETIARLKTWLNKTETFTTGNRNNYITKLAASYHRFGISEAAATNDLLNFVQTDFKSSEIIATIKSIYRQTQWFASAKFKVSESYATKNTAQETEPIIINKEIPLLPIDGFPDFIQFYINEYVKVYNVPRDYIAASVIFSVALAIGNKLELQGKYKNVPVLWLAIVGNVSTGKTEPLINTLKHFNSKDSRAFEIYKQLLDLYNIEQEKPKKERDLSLKRPQWFQYILNDYTPEALASIHTTNNRGLCIYRDELKGWLDDFGRYSKSGEQSNMLSSFFGVPIKFNRVGKEPLNIDAPCLFVAGGIQPDLLPTLAQDSRAESGFLSRFIFAYPDNQIKQNYSKNQMDLDLLNQYHLFLEKLTSLDEKIKITLSIEAELVYENWFNENVKISNDEPTGYLKGVYGKLDVIVLRLAIVLHGMKLVCSGDGEDEIQELTMQKATDLIEYFRATAIKVYNKIFIENNAKNLDKKDVIKYLHSLGASQNKIASALIVTQPYVQKILKS